MMEERDSSFINASGAEKDTENARQIRNIEQQLDNPELAPDLKDKLLERLAELKGMPEPEDE